ncbi:MAG TPA: DMT family transporter [Myxococcota bacterium]|nr:DMT family transporter [Myxococcota bacterium]HRY94849.1 DMT family transporter [Myxococcota bacterium]HSA22847.1 DMT family transporter [Myxococcota bacterium]
MPTHLERLRTNGMLLMALSALLFSGMAALAKVAAQRIPPAEVVLFRSLLGALLLLAWHLGRGGRLGELRGQQRGLLALRGLLGGLAVLLYFYGLTGLRVADGMLLNSCAPLFVLALSAPLLGERVSRAQLLAVPPSVAGVALVLKPSLSLVNWPGLAALASAALAAGAYICVRKLARTERALVVVLYYTLASALLAAPVAALGWRSPDGPTWLALLGVAALGVAAQLVLTAAYRYDTAGRVSMVGYLGPLFGAGWDLGLWGAAPDPWSALGAALVIGSLVWIHLRARQAPGPGERPG